MSDLRPRVRRLRSDALRSRAALLDAAIGVLAVDPGADLARVAADAGLSRQTLYAHFGSRHGLLDAVAERITTEFTLLLDEARLDEGDAADALLRFLDLFDALPPEHVRAAVIATADRTTAEEVELHAPILAALTCVVRRGQADGAFTSDLPASWLAEATIALGHAAYEMETRGTLTRRQANTAMRTSLLRLCTTATH